MATIKQLQDGTGDVYPIIGPNTVGAEAINISSVLDIFYPVGSYYETSNASFDPNTTWGGTWVLDSQGRVTVSQNSDTFATIGATGGTESHDHEYSIKSNIYWSQFDKLQVYDYATNTWKEGTSGSSQSGQRTNNNAAASTKTVADTPFTAVASTSIGSTLQPYIVVKRWHRTA